MRWPLIVFAAAAALTACAPPAARQAPAPEASAPAAIEAPAGEYRLDPTHADLTFRVNHIGMSMYTARFERFDATLRFDPADPRAMRLEASVDPNSLVLPAPPAGFREELLGPDWLNARQFRTIAFRATRIEPTGARSARMEGDLTLHGVTAPIALDVTYNGGYAGHSMDPNARIGFSARGRFNRSEFGVAHGVPPPGSTMGVSDAVDVLIEAEFTGPAWTAPVAR